MFNVIFKEKKAILLPPPQKKIGNAYIYQLGDEKENPQKEIPERLEENYNFPVLPKQGRKVSTEIWATKCIQRMR